MTPSQWSDWLRRKADGRITAHIHVGILVALADTIDELLQQQTEENDDEPT